MNFFGKNGSDDESAIEAMAAAWLAQRDDGLSPDKAEEFARWRRENPRHEAVVTRLEDTWQTLLQLRHFRPEARIHPDRDLLAAAGRRHPVRFRVLAWTAAAAAAAAIGAAAWWQLQSKTGEPAQTYATTNESYERVVLSDGSVTEMNTSSELQVRYTPGERRIRLMRGEAHFTVAKNKVRPFWVEAGGVAVRAVGTAFDVRLTDREVDVIVTEGRVTLTEKAVAADSTLAANPAAPEPASLAAGERAVIALGRAQSAPVIQPVAPEIIRDALAWEEGRLVFAATPLSEVVNEFNRSNPVQIELADPELGARPITGSFRPENAEAFVRLLAQGGDITVEHPAPDRIVLRRAR